MKPKKIIFAITILYFTYACNSTKSQNDHLMEITGTIKAIEMSSWQYGTHTISNDENFYALRSEKVDLTKYEGKRATITAKPIEGYPVDGGPVLLEVSSIKE